MLINQLVGYAVRYGKLVDMGQKLTLCAKLRVDHYGKHISQVVWIDHYVDSGLNYVNCPAMGVHNQLLDVTTAIIAW